MARTVNAAADMNVPAGTARRLWTDTSRWATFVDGFARVTEQTGDWPEVGSKVVWESGPAGRGQVTERVVDASDDYFATDVFEDRMSGRQSVWFQDGQVIMELEYELASRSPFRGITDFFFIRRALSDALMRTVTRFSTEAAEEAAL